jgi:hypothetical protein
MARRRDVVGGDAADALQLTAAIVSSKRLATSVVQTIRS